MTVSVSSPRLTETDPAPTRAFVKLYGKNRGTVVSRAKQLQSAKDEASTTTTEAVLPLELGYRVDAMHFTSRIELGFIEDVTSFDDITNEQVQKCIDKEEEESKDAVTLKTTDELDETRLKMSMDNHNFKSKMQSLFANYHSLLSQNGVKWIIKNIQKLTVTHFLSVVKPQSLRERLVSDLSFSHHALKKDFKKFLLHSVNLSEAFQIVSAGPEKKSKKKNENNR